MDNDARALSPLDEAVRKLLSNEGLTDRDRELLAAVPPRALLIACTLIREGEASTVDEVLDEYRERLEAHGRALERRSGFRVVGRNA